MSLAHLKDEPWTTALPDDEWEEVKQGVPAKDEAFINQYIAGREALIVQEKKQRSDYAFRQSLSPIAKEACNIVGRIRDEEGRTVWTAELENKLAKETGANVYPGMMFGLAKEKMEKTKLWQIVRKMPKGALLHAHLDAMVDLDFIFGALMETPGMHVYCEHSLSDLANSELAPIRFKYLKSENVTKTSIWSPDYIPDTPIPVNQAADAFPNGGKAGFQSYFRARCSITGAESVEHHHGVDHVWQIFSSIFPVFGTILFYEPIFRAYMQRLMSSLHADGVKWIDLRIAFVFKYYKAGSEEAEPTYEEFFRVFGEEIEKFKASEEGKGFWGARMIWTGLRALDTRKIIEDMDSCIATKLVYPHLISGYDLVGQEDAGRPLKDILPELFWFKKQCAQEGVDIPFFFHAGECLGDGSDTDQNLFDAILLGTRRIGHGYSLYKHPLLIDMVKEKKILIESCPISNEVLRLCASIMSHTLPALLARGVACSLCNDDPAILGQDTAGMTHDFWQALQGWENLGLAGLGSLAENSVRWAAFEDQNAADWTKDIKEASLGNGVRAQRMQEWSIQWEQFCLWIVTEFGDDAEGIKKLMADTSLMFRIDWGFH